MPVLHEKKKKGKKATEIIPRKKVPDSMRHARATHELKRGGDGAALHAKPHGAGQRRPQCFTAVCRPPPFPQPLRRSGGADPQDVCCGSAHEFRIWICIFQDGRARSRESSRESKIKRHRLSSRESPDECTSIHRSLI